MSPPARAGLPPPLAWLSERPYFQAGLQGYSDAAMRILARRHGAPYCVTESLLDEMLVRGGKGLSAQALDPEDHPVAGQIIGTNPPTMARAARLLVEQGHDVIDVNLACPVKKVREVCRGGHLLTRPELAADILRAVLDSVGGDVPVTVKLRRAFDDSPREEENFHRVLESAIALGVTAATVHARTVVQKYEGQASWPFLADLTRRYGAFPLLGSGDVFSAEAIREMLGATGVRGVSVARGAIGNPWIFRQARDVLAGLAATPPPLEEQRDSLAEHFRLAERLGGADAAGRAMRKVGIKASRFHPRATEVERAFVACRSSEDWWRTLDEHYGSTTPATARGV